MEKKPEEDDRVAPSVVKKPKAKVVDEGVDATFECTLLAKPAPEVMDRLWNIMPKKYISNCCQLVIKKLKVK
jgi:hypothetical protein